MGQRSHVVETQGGAVIQKLLPHADGAELAIPQEYLDRVGIAPDDEVLFIIYPAGPYGPGRMELRKAPQTGRKQATNA